MTSPSDKLDQQLERAAEILASSKAGVALTGAGISTPSGIPDFRSTSSGLWENANPMEVASIYGFRLRPKAFFNWIRPLAETLLQAEPNPAHTALADLEAAGIIRAIVTQNIDMLHTRAGSETVYEVHGSVATGTCIKCYQTYPKDDFIADFVEKGEPPTCPKDHALIKPDVVLFGEQLPAIVFHEAQRAVKNCDVMLVAGSSLEVAPVSEMPRLALNKGAALIVINYQETYIDGQADVVIREDVATVLPHLVDLVTARLQA